jgi:hypothetical protein
MKDYRKLIGAAILLAVVVAFAALSFGGVLNLPGSSNDVAVLWRNSITPPAEETAVLWRNSVTPPADDVAVLWRNSITPPAEELAVLWRDKREV